MKFFDLSSAGVVSILGVSIGTAKSYAVNTLKEYGVKENKNCLYIENLTLQPEIPSIRIIFSLDKEFLRVKYIQILGSIYSNLVEADRFCFYMKRT